MSNGGSVHVNRSATLLRPYGPLRQHSQGLPNPRGNHCHQSSIILHRVVYTRVLRRFHGSYLSPPVSAHSIPIPTLCCESFNIRRLRHTVAYYATENHYID